MQVNFLAEAFTQILGNGEQGSIAYSRCFDGSKVIELCSDQALKIPAWKLFGIVSPSNANASNRLITADRAVDYREAKTDPALLLIDVEGAGAGMDGIYSAGREIKERELFATAVELAKKSIGNKTLRQFCADAVKVARRVGRHNTIAPSSEYDFYCRCAADPETAGAAVAILGLWPIRFLTKFDPATCSTSARLVEKCLLAPTSLSSRTRVESLMLRDATEEQIQTLTAFLQEVASLWWKEAVARLQSYPQLWLNNIRPGFLEQQIESIEIDPWKRKGSDKPYAWSGLRNSELGLEALINKDPQSPRERSKIEVRWHGHPDSLAKGAVEYKVKLIYGQGEDELLEQTVMHSGPGVQRAVFTETDFEQFEGSEKFECYLTVEALTKDREIRSDPTETFILHFGQPDAVPTSSAGIVERSFAEGMIAAEEEALFIETASDRSSFAEDKNHHVNARLKGGIAAGSGRVVRVFRPPLLQQLEAQWAALKGRIGRWSVSVRADGSVVGAPEFHEIGQGRCSTEIWEAVSKASERLCEYVSVGYGFVSLVYNDNKISDRYVTTWQEAIETGDPELSIANTVEVRALSGATIGLIVLPNHPVRVGWHSAYDAFIRFARYHEHLSRKAVIKAAGALDGSLFPWCLPGINSSQRFIFGDMLGFHAVAMVLDDDREPKAAIAQMARAFGIDDAIGATSVGTADILSKEIDRYLDLHRGYETLHVNGLRCGDAMILCRALGKRFETEELEDRANDRINFVLELYPSDQQRGVAGRFLMQASERRRSGAGHTPREDRWMFQSYMSNNAVAVPKLRWAKRDREIPSPDTASHLSVAFDASETRIETIPIEELVSRSRPFEVFGLSAPVERKFGFHPEPTWIAFYPPELRGAKHPAGSGITDRLHRIQRAVHGAVARHLGGGGNDWPALKTVLRVEQRELFERLHQISDWVISVDRNAGIEYFDSPRDAENVFDHYVIDCVPERDDLGAFQLVTSTAHFEEVMALLESALAEMGLSTSRANCEFLLRQLKALSGRMAMRLASQGTAAGELIALALVFSNCREAIASPLWPSLQNGFLVPLDDVPELVKRQDEDSEENCRGDLLHVSIPKRGSNLHFEAIEVKYRRYLRSAREQALFRHVAQQTENTITRFVKRYFPSENGAQAPSESELAPRRAQLGRVLRFYLEKAKRHYLGPSEYERIGNEIDSMLQQGAKYTASAAVNGNRGFVFCPEFQAADAESVFSSDGTEIVLFGPSRIPDTATRASFARSSAKKDEAGDLSEGAGNVELTNVPEKSPKPPDITTSELDAVLLGATADTDIPVRWEFGIRTNPHLMVVGLPGMGKTSALVNICSQLPNWKITPIVFSYHEDIDDRLATRLGALKIIDYDGLGFNPMHVSRHQPNAYIDNAGMIRDIFGSIFPELGDLQLELIREAVKQAYRDCGWNGTGIGQSTPPFQLVYDNLKAGRKDQRLLMRLNELDDYGFFSAAGTAPSPLTIVEPTVIRVHTTQNENLQNAFASFVLHHIYQSMFVRGEQKRLTHALVVDEAHRAGRLKLIPTLAKECRKYGIMLIIASQEARDFQPALFSAIGNYLVLRVTDQDAKVLGSQSGNSRNKAKVIDQLKEMRKYHALFFNVDTGRPQYLALRQ
jgi:DNA phosphorothioation-dependent restriction protein DptH